MSNGGNTPATPKTRSFVDVISEIDDGSLVGELGEQLRRLVKAVQETGKKGALSLKLSIDIDKRGMISIMPDVRLTTPSAAVKASLFFTTEDGDVLRDDPRQVPLRGVPMRPPTPLKVVDKGATPTPAPVPITSATDEENTGATPPEREE